MSESYKKEKIFDIDQNAPGSTCYDLVTCSLAPGLTLSQKDKQNVLSYISHLSGSKSCAVAGLWL